MDPPEEDVWVSLEEAGIVPAMRDVLLLSFGLGEGAGDLNEFLALRPNQQLKWGSFVEVTPPPFTLTGLQRYAVMNANKDPSMLVCAHFVRGSIAVIVCSP